MSLRELQRRHRRFHARHDFKLQRRLFWWFGFTTFMACCVAFGVMRLVSPDTHGWRKDAQRLEQFASGRFAQVWRDADARRELTEAVAQAFDASLRVEDTRGELLNAVGQECRDGAVRLEVKRGGVALGTVHGCLQNRGPRWYAGLATLFAAFLTIWAATGKLARHITRPLQDLTRVTREIGEGKLESRVRLGYHHKGEVGILADSINEMAKRIERQLRDQRELLASVSHEIRSPLARLRVLSELLQGGSPTPDLHAKIEREVAEIDDLVGKLLASSRLDFEALDLQVLCARDVALRSLERAGLPPQLLTDTSLCATVRGDATLLSRALGNLLENAQHHAGGVESLTLRANGTHVCVDVADRGAGLSAQALSHGFDPFYRGSQDGQASSRGALGLGLSLVRRIARAHGGDATIQNRAEGGALATLSIPRAQEG
ncbi:MAG: periplasmic sensor signal transduction histidine kinase [Polyangiaceae bacterium]|jgi:signal transduction histidine kinase|nr:periplasmic sensor signal transduction histidine kinase [Polyangiaceae bacterium]